MSWAERIDHWLLGPAGSDGSGPAVARLFQRWLGFITAIAFASFGVQAVPLVGAQGIQPWRPVAEQLASEAVPFLQWPSWLRLWSDDLALQLGCALGTALGLMAMSGVGARAAFALSIPLYAGLMLAGGEFFHFQWDQLLLECLALAVVLPTDRRARSFHAVFRLLLFKLYLESGLAKLWSPLHDWQGGQAMAAYYETAPLPSPLAFWAHHLPASWHQLEGWAVLAIELLLPLFVFGPRPLRLLSFAGLGLFQAFNLATASYGFFVPLSLGLHLFLLDDHDLPEGLRAWLGKVPLFSLTLTWGQRSFRAAVLVLYALVSAIDGAAYFTPALLPGPVARWQAQRGPVRWVSSYHLFAGITTQRYEPELQTTDDDVTWEPHDLRWKPGTPTRSPTWNTPHQPRLDFQMWFYGLGHDQAVPYWVEGLLERACHAPAAISPLFLDPLPAAPKAVRIVFWDTHFATPDQLAREGLWWDRKLLAVGPVLNCR